MQVHFFSSARTLAFKTSTVLACAWLLTACNSKVIEPIRLQSAPGAVSLPTASDQKEPMVVNYGVPDTSQVVFEPIAQTQTEDLTF